MSRNPRMKYSANGYVLVLVLIAIILATILGLAMIRATEGQRIQAVKAQNEIVSLLAAEAGYEQAVFWMSQQDDMLYVLKSGGSTSNSISFPDTNSQCDYTISFYTFLGHRPAYKITSVGKTGTFERQVEVTMLQAISGWNMGMCRVPNGGSSTTPVYFADGEVIDMPIHINKLDDNPDDKDINVTGSPRFLQRVSMSESRYQADDTDKYSGTLGFFEDGIDFDQPNSRITKEASIIAKVTDFKENTLETCKFIPVGNASISNPQPAVQLEFFVDQNVGKVRITNNCTVRGFRRSSDDQTWDYRIKPGSGGQEFERYDIYSYHLAPDDADATGQRVVMNVEDTYVSQSIGGVQSDPGGQIFVDGNVIIGGPETKHNGNQLIKGKVTVVATGNIWIGDSLLVDGIRNGQVPVEENPNALGLIAQGIVRVVDPGMSDYSYVDDDPDEPSGYDYIPIGIHDSGQSQDSHKRHLPNPFVIEGAITVGGGGFGAENVQRGSSGGRKETSGGQDDLVLRGALSEVIRGVVGLIGNDGFLKHYRFDPRLYKGILPGDFWLTNKYIPAPAGWKDHNPNM